jgi:hypothetical protein
MMNRTRNEALDGTDGVRGLLGIVSAPVKRRESRPRPDGGRPRQAWAEPHNGTEDTAHPHGAK